MWLRWFSCRQQTASPLSTILHLWCHVLLNVTSILHSRWEQDPVTQSLRVTVNVTSTKPFFHVYTIYNPKFRDSHRSIQTLIFPQKRLFLFCFFSFKESRLRCTACVRVIRLLRWKSIRVDKDFLNPLTCKRKPGFHYLHVPEIGLLLKAGE